MRNNFSKFLIGFLIAAQLTFSFSFLLVPKPAKAFLGIGDFTFTTEVGNFYDILKDVGLGVAQRIAINYANKYIQRFVDKLIDKYRIKDYLAYEKVLSGYYLNQYVYQNVDDPDLRAIYGILARDINSRANVTLNGQTRPVLAALRDKIDDYYYGYSGANPNWIYNPDTFANDRDYFEAARAYFASPPYFAYEEVYSQFAGLQSRTTSAAQQEIGNSDGLKNDRATPTGTLAKHCTSLPAQYTDEEGTQQPTPKANAVRTEGDCRYYGGQWTVNPGGVALSVIRNPSSFVHDFATNGIKSIFEANFGIRDNIYTTIGSLLGNFLFNKMNLNTSSGTLNEVGDDPQPDNGTPEDVVTQTDLDGDGIADVIVDADGNESCIYGGLDDGSGGVQIGPPCKGSQEALRPAPGYNEEIPPIPIDVNVNIDGGNGNGNGNNPPE